MTSVRAEATSGSAILNCVVNAPFSDSPGTRKVTTAVCPGEALSDSARTCADADAVPVSSPIDIVAPVTATVIRAREGAPVVDLIRLWLSCVVGMVGQRARLTGGPRCDTEAASRSAERSGWSARRAAVTGRAATGQTMRTAARTARDSARHSRSPAAMRAAPTTIASRWAASIAAAGGADESGVVVARGAEHQVAEELADGEQAEEDRGPARAG